MEEVRARGGRRRLWVIVGALSALALVLLGLGLSYLFIVVRDQPLLRGFTYERPTGSTFVRDAPGAEQGADILEYAGGATFTVTEWVHNGGRFALTVTGVETTDPRWRGLMTLIDARAGVQRFNHCCIIDAQKTWAPDHFVPLTLKPDEEGAIVVRYRMGHCDHFNPDAYNADAGVTVFYDVLGNGHSTFVPYPEPVMVRYSKTAECLSARESPAAARP